MLGMTQATYAGEVITSPDGRVSLEIDVKDGKPCYQVKYDGQVMIGESALGLVTNMGDFSRNLTMTDVKTVDIKDEYILRNIKQSHVSYEAREAVAHY
jgi:hypothetical protein